MSLIAIYLKGLEDALSPPLRAILWRVLGIGLLLSVLLVFGAYQGLGFAPSTGMGWLDETIRVLGGNQGDKVSIENFPKSQVLGYRWPEAA